MAFYPNEKQHKLLSKKQFIETYNEYCDWCWGHDYGNCDKCKERKDVFMDENYKEKEAGCSVDSTTEWSENYCNGICEGCPSNKSKNKDKQ